MTFDALNEIQYSRYYPDSGLDITSRNYRTFDFKTGRRSDQDTDYYRNRLHSVHRLKAIN